MKASNTNDDTKDGTAVSTQQLKLSSGTKAEVMTASPRSLFMKKKPPLIFIHGSFHASWCWAECK